MGILLLTKSVFAIMIGFLFAIVLGLILIPILKRRKIGQSISLFVGESHKKKEGTPTMGGLIFVIPTVLITAALVLMDKIEMTSNLMIILFVFVGYAFIGFLDDFLSIKRKNNEGLTTYQKLFLQLVIALVFFYLYMKNGGSTALYSSTLGINIEMGWLYGAFLLFILIGASNAVNLTDGLDGLAGGLSMIAFLSFGIITWGTTWVEGYQEMAIFCFILVGSLLGFLVYNTHPAKVFMGDTGSLSLGATLAAIAILTKHELSLALIGGVFVIETLSSIIQLTAIKKFGKKVFLMTPLHHHFEKLGWDETDIVKMFLIAGFMMGMVAIYYGVWM